MRNPVLKVFSLSCSIFVSAGPLTIAQSAGPTMKAIVVHQFGGPEVLKYEDAARPEPKEDEILIRTMAAGVNPVDAFIRSGRFGKESLPYIPGMEVAGIVEKTGGKISKFKSGDPVYAHLGFKMVAMPNFQSRKKMKSRLNRKQSASSKRRRSLWRQLPRGRL